MTARYSVIDRVTMVAGALIFVLVGMAGVVGAASMIVLVCLGTSPALLIAAPFALLLGVLFFCIGVTMATEAAQ